MQSVISCPHDIGFDDTFPNKECEMRRFYDDCYHCWQSSLARNRQTIQYATLDKVQNALVARIQERINSNMINFTDAAKSNDITNIAHYSVLIVEEQELRQVIADAIDELRRAVVPYP